MPVAVAVAAPWACAFVSVVVVVAVVAADLPRPVCATSAATVEELVAMALFAIASGTVESPLEAGMVALVVTVVFAIATAMGVGICAAVGFGCPCAAESVCAAVWSADLSEDLPVDLPSPV